MGLPSFQHNHQNHDIWGIGGYLDCTGSIYKNVSEKDYLFTSFLYTLSPSGHGAGVTMCEGGSCDKTEVENKKEYWI